MEEDQQNKRFRTVFRWLGYSLLFFLFLTFLISLLVQVPIVQNWVVQRVSQRLAKDLGAEVKVGHVRLNVFEDLLVEDLLVRDLKGDTLLYSARAYLNVEQPLISALKKHMVFESVELEQTVCYLKTDVEGNTNYGFIQQYFLDGDSVTSEAGVASDDSMKGFSASFRHFKVSTGNIVISHQNARTGETSSLSLARGDIELEWDNKMEPLVIKNIVLNEPRYLLENRGTRTSNTLVPTVRNYGESFDDRFPEEIIVEKMQIVKGAVKLKALARNRNYMPKNVIDWQDLAVDDINVVLHDLHWRDGRGTAVLELLQLETPEGFDIEDLSSTAVSFSAKSLLMKNATIQTRRSSINSQLSFSFADWSSWKDFENDVEFSIRLNKSLVGLNDILHFARNLQSNEFFMLNGDEQILLTSHITGSINDLRASNIDLKLGDQLFLLGDLHLTDATMKGREWMSLIVNNSEIHISDMRRLVPNFNLPSNYDKMGDLIFTGEYEGLFNDFIASGNLITDLGVMNMDVGISWENGGIRNADYQGKINLIEFDLASWTGSDNFGPTSIAAEIKDGRGLDVNEAHANLHAVLEDFYFKGYHYGNAEMQGQLNRQFFEGKFYINDPNITMDFDGHADLRGVNPKFDFFASIEYADFGALNLVNRSMELSGDMNFDFTYHDLYNFDGTIEARDLRILDDTTLHELDSIQIIYALNDDGSKNLRVVSDVSDFYMIGSFDIQHLPSTVKYLIENKHPLLSEKLQLGRFVSDSIYIPQSFHFDGTLTDSRGLQKLVNASLADFTELTMNGSFSGDSSGDFRYRMDMHAPGIQYGTNIFEDVALDLKGENGESTWDIYAEQMKFGRKELYPVLLHSNLTHDSLEFSLKAQAFSNVFTDIDLQGLLYLNDSLFQIDLANSSFSFLNEPWKIVPQNFIQIGDRFIKTENMVFLSDESYIRVSSPGDNSLDIEAEKVSISFLDDLPVKNKLKYRGYANTHLHISDIFEHSPITLSLTIDSLNVNGDDYGVLISEINLPDLANRGTVDLVVENGKEILGVHGTLFVPLQSSTRETPFYDIDFTLTDLPLKIGEYFIGHSISNTRGTANGRFKIYSGEKGAGIRGFMTLDGELKVDYLGTTYAMHEQIVHLNPYLFDLSGSLIEDELGNVAIFSGGITHDHFKGLGMNASLRSDYFQFLKTTIKDNSIYYGNGIGEGDIHFGGDFMRASMKINCTTGPGTQLYIPLEENYREEGGSFITYLFDRDSVTEQVDKVNLTGINLDMQLNVTPDAQMQLIFDEFSGDIIKGTGTGNLNLTKERAGDLQMTGRYTINEGEYLYTLLDFINKPFIVDQGGIITWTGDPLNADLNIRARYSGLKAPPRNLIAEYLEGRVNTREAEVADISTPVDLIMDIRGILSEPEIGFDIRFPDIDPTIRNITESKLRILREDISELNRQVYGLLLSNTFFPSTTNVNLTSTTVNTLSEFITSQLSNYVAAYITEGVEEVEYISGVDFYFDYNYFRSEDFLQGQQTGVRFGSEFALAPNIRFFDDRFIFSPGASVIQGTVNQSSSFIGTDVSLDFYVTDDKRLKLSLFYKRLPSLGGARNKVGLGFQFTKSYDSFADIFRRRKKATDETIDPGVFEIELKEGNR